MAYFTKWFVLYSVHRGILSQILQLQTHTYVSQMVLGRSSSLAVSFLNQFIPKASDLGQTVRVSKRLRNRIYWVRSTDALVGEWTLIIIS